MNRAVIDTGPIVAFLCPRDRHHSWAQCAFGLLAPGSVVCEAALTEVCHLVAKEGIAQARVIDFVARLRLNCVSLANDLQVIRGLLHRYSDAPMDFADACVVRLAELNPALPVCTIDRQFSFFRKNGDEPISLIAPFTSSK